MTLPAPRLVGLDVQGGARSDTQSGLQMLRPRIWGALQESAARAGVRKPTAAIVMHPASNFMGHYLIEPLAARGICCMGLNSRYVGNDTVENFLYLNDGRGHFKECGTLAGVDVDEHGTANGSMGVDFGDRSEERPCRERVCLAV